MSNQFKIQSALIASVTSHQHFHERTYTNSGVAMPVEYDPETAPSIQPDSVRTNELSSSFTTDRHNGMSQVLKRTNWSWLMVLEWSGKEIDFCTYIKDLQSNIPFIARTATNDKIRLFLLKYDVEHPAQADATTGTTVKLLFNAEVVF